MTRQGELYTLFGEKTPDPALRSKLEPLTGHYVRVTGDASVLDERAGFITMPVLKPDQHELYDLPQPFDKSATVYDHCLLALRRAWLNAMSATRSEAPVTNHRRVIARFRLVR